MIITKKFLDLGVSPALSDALIKLGYSIPTPIQTQTIPLVLSGRDVLASAPTGTGKTGAFAMPLLTRLLANPNEAVLVLSPTRELATQIMQAFMQIAGKNRIDCALLIGGAPMFQQMKQLRNQPRIVIGTPGRINDHLERRSLNLSNFTHVVLDETDRMLDMGFEIQIKTIISELRADRQTLMFSATLQPEIMKMAHSYLNDPVRVSVGDASAPSITVTQSAILTTEKEKHQLLLDYIAQATGSIIVFAKTKRGAEELAIRLSTDELWAEAIHGDLRQSKREKIILAFRNQRFRVMIATDVAARGIDIPHIQHVINYDLPQCPEDYIHRIGRTGRAGSAGMAHSFISPGDNAKWRAIRRIIGAESAKDLPELGGQGRDVKGSGAGRHRSGGSGRFGSKSPQRDFAFRGRNDSGSMGHSSRGDAPEHSGSSPRGDSDLRQRPGSAPVRGGGFNNRPRSGAAPANGAPRPAGAGRTRSASKRS